MADQEHILVVEDEPITREQLVSYFEDEGFRVSSTGSISLSRVSKFQSIPSTTWL